MYYIIMDFFRAYILSSEHVYLIDYILKLCLSCCQHWQQSSSSFLQVSSPHCNNNNYYVSFVIILLIHICVICVKERLRKENEKSCFYKYLAVQKDWTGTDDCFCCFPSIQQSREIGKRILLYSERTGNPTSRVDINWLQTAQIF